MQPFDEIAGPNLHGVFHVFDACRRHGVARIVYASSNHATGMYPVGEPLTEHVHIAFGVETNEAVDAFHRAAIAAGYTDNGAPGERAAYHPGYYGAFVLDPDGHNIEAVNHNRS